MVKHDCGEIPLAGQRADTRLTDRDIACLAVSGVLIWLRRRGRATGSAALNRGTLEPLEQFKVRMQTRLGPIQWVERPTDRSADLFLWSHDLDGAISLDDQLAIPSCAPGLPRLAFARRVRLATLPADGRETRTGSQCQKRVRRGGSTRPCQLSCPAASADRIRRTASMISKELKKLASGDRALRKRQTGGFHRSLAPAGREL